MRRRELISLALLVACKKAEPTEAPKGAESGRSGSAITGAAPLASKEFFRVDAGPRTPCTAGQPCEARLVLTALGDYHVNEKYPFKLVTDASPGVTFEGTGNFVLDDAKTGTLTVRYTKAVRGTAKVTGTFKLSVCTDENCQIESPKVAFDVAAE